MLNLGFGGSIAEIFYCEDRSRAITKERRFLMTKLTATKMTSNALQIGSAFVLVSFGSACGSSDSAGSNDGGNRSDSASNGEIGATDGATPGQGDDGASAGDAASAADVASMTDGANGADGSLSRSTLAVDLKSAGGYVILAKSAVSTVPASAITGNLGLSPAAASFITGFSLTADATNVFASSPQITGKVYAADYAVPTPSNLTTAIGDMQSAFTDAAGRAPDVTELGAGNIGGMTLTPGVYKWGTGLLIPTDVTLTGSATDVSIFQVAADLTVSSATKVALAGGAVPANVFWEVAGAVNLGTTAHLEGIVLTQTAITLATGASITGRLLAQTAVSIDSSAVVGP